MMPGLLNTWSETMEQLTIMHELVEPILFSVFDSEVDFVSLVASIHYMQE